MNNVQISNVQFFCQFFILMISFVFQQSRVNLLNWWLDKIFIVCIQIKTSCFVMNCNIVCKGLSLSPNDGRPNTHFAYNETKSIHFIEAPYINHLDQIAIALWILLFDPVDDLRNESRLKGRIKAVLGRTGTVWSSNFKSISASPDCGGTISMWMEPRKSLSLKTPLTLSSFLNTNPPLWGKRWSMN